MSASKPAKSHGPGRREFLASSSAIAASISLGQRPAPGAPERLALNGGPKAVSLPTEPAMKWPRYGKAEEQAVLAILRDPVYDPIDKLEAEWREFLGVPHAKAHCNGTSTLASMFFALNLPPGSEILVPSHTFFATIMPMRLFGLVPVFVDINPRTLNFDLDDAKKRLTPRTKAVLPVHWLGLPADMDEIGAWAKEKGLILLEDAAHAHGATLRNKRMGAWGRMAIFSYQTTKPLPAIEGGMGCYQFQEDYDRATAFGHYLVPGVAEDGPCAKYLGTGLGLKFRMHPVSAELARCQLRVLDERNRAITRQLRRLNDPLLDLKGLSDQSGTRKDMERVHYGRNILFLDEKAAGTSRASIVKALAAEGVQASEHRYRLQHEQPVYTEAEWWHHLPDIPELPGSAQANATAIGLPLLTEEAPELVDQYIRAFQKVWAHRKELT